MLNLARTQRNVQLLPWVVGGLIVMIAGAILAGLWAGNRWAEGQHAIDRNRELEQQVALQVRRYGELQEFAAEAVLAYDQAAQRLDLIADQQEKDREANRVWREGLRAELDRLLDARPDLRELRLGTDVLHHWNRSNAGPVAESAAAGDRSEPAAAVPGAATGAGRSGSEPAGEPRPGDRAVPRLPHGEGQPGPGGARVGGDGLGLVLPGAAADGSAR